MLTTTTNRSIAMGAGLLVCVLLGSGCSNYYKVRDPQTGKVYYTENLKQRNGGAVTLKDGKSGDEVTIRTTGDKLHPVQQAFLDCNAFQCGYCTPGMIMATVALLAQKPNPTEDEIREGMNGNLCRCCAYANIHAAVKRAAEQVAK